MKGKDSDNYNEDSGGDESFKDISDLLKKFYQPKEEPDLWSSIEKKLYEEEPVSEIIKESEEIEKDFIKREQKLEKMGKLIRFPNAHKNLQVIEGSKDQENPEHSNIFHKEILIDDSEGILTIEERYWTGLSEYLDDEASPDRQRIISHHLMDCSLCRSRFNRLSDLNSIFRDSMDPRSQFNEADFKDEFWTKIEHKIEETPVSPFHLIWRYKKHAVAASLTLLIALGSIASLRYKDEYNYMIPPQDGEINWKALELKEDQVKKLNVIDDEWIAFKKQQEAIIVDRRMKLDKELAKTNLNLSLIDKYQREILDNEITLKRQEVNVFIEKRFVLSEKQTLKLLKSLRDSSN